MVRLSRWGGNGMSKLARTIQMSASASAVTAPQEFTRVGVSFPVSNMNIQVPSGSQAGDIAIAYSSTATGPAPTVYAGFTEIASVNSIFEDMFQYKILTSGDLTTTFSRYPDSYDAAIMVTFRPLNPVTSVNVSWVRNSGETSGTPNNLFYSTSQGNGQSILIATYSSYGSEPSINGGSFWDQNYLEVGEGNNMIKMYYKIFSDSSNAGYVTAGDYGGYNIMMSCVINAS